jgi:hypothetical protein
MRDTGNEYKSFVEKPEGWRVLGRSSRQWEDNIKIAVREIGYKGVD